MTRPSLVGGAPPHHVTEDTPVDLFEGSMDLLVVLPNDKCVPMSFERKLALMDVLMQIGNAHKFSPGGHVLEIADSLGNNLQCKPSTRLGSLNAHTVYVVARNRINDRLKAKVFKAIPHQETEKTQQPFENTFRVQVRLPRNQLHVIRAAWRTPLSQIVNQVCQERGLDPQKYQLRHPVRLDECLDLNRSLGDYQLQEVCLVSLGESGSSHFNPSDLSTMKKVTKSPSSDINSVNSAEKKRRSLFGFVFGKKTKSTIGDANMTSSDTNVVASPLRSEEPVASPPEAEVAVPTQAAAVTPTPPSPVLVSKRLAEEAVAKRNSRLMMLGTLANNHVSNVQQNSDQSQQPQPKPPARMKKKAAAPPPPSATTSTITTTSTTVVDTTPSKNGSKMAGSVVSVSSGSSESTIVSSQVSVLPRSAPGSEVGSDLSSGYDRPAYRSSVEPPSPAKRPIGGSRNIQSISDLSTGAKKSVPARTSLSNLTQVNSTSEVSLSSASKKRKAPPPPPAAAPVAASEPAEKLLAASAVPVVALAAPVAASEPSAAQQLETTKASLPAVTSSPASIVAAPHVAPKPSARKTWKHSSSSSSSSSNSDDLDVEDLDMFTSKPELENRKTGENISLVSSEDDLEECIIVHQAQDATNQWDLSSELFPEPLIGGVLLDIPLQEKRLSVSSRSEFYSISSRSSVRSSSSDSETEIQEMQMKLLLQRQKNKEAIPADLSMIPIEELRDLNDTSPDDTKNFRRSFSEVNFSPEDSGLVLSTSPIRSQSYTINGQTSATSAVEPRWNGFNDLPLEEALASFQIKGRTRQTGRSSVSSEDSTNDRTLTNPNEDVEKEPSYGTITFSPVFDRDAAKVEILSDIPVSEALYAMVVKKPKSIQPVVKESPSKNVEKRSRSSSSSSSDDSIEEDVPEPPKNVPEPAETVLKGFSSVEKVPEPRENTPVVPERTESVPETVESAPDSPVMWNHQLPQPPPMFQDDQSDSEASSLDVSIGGSETGCITPIGSSSSGKEPVENVLTEVSGTSEVPLMSVTLSMGAELEQETATDDLIPAEPGTIVLERDPYGESTTEDVAIPPPEFDCKNQSSSSESDTEPSERDSLDEEDPAELLENPGSLSAGTETSMKKSAAPDSSVEETVTEKLEAPSLLAFFSQAQSSLNSTADPAAKALQEEFQRLQQQFLAWQQNQQPQPKQQEKRHTSSSSSSSRDTECESDDEGISKKKRNKRKAKGKKKGSQKAEEEEEEEMMKKKEEEERVRKEEEDKKKREEEERMKREEEEWLKREVEEKKKREEEERLKKEEEAMKKEEEERQKKEEKERKRREKEEKKRREEEEERRKKEEDERKKKEEEEQKKRKEEEEKLKKEEERRKREEEERLKKEEEEMKRREEEAKLQEEEEERQRRLKEEQSKEEIRDKMLKLLETEELVLAEREKELQKRRKALVTEKPSRHESSSSSSSDSSDNESSDVVIRREPVYRYRGPPQVKLEPWKPGRPRSEVIDLSTELTYDIPAPLLAKQSDIPVSDISFPSGPKSASRDSPDSGIGGYDSLPTIPVSSPVKPEPPAKSESLFRKTSTDTPRPFATNSAPLNLKRMSFVPLVNPVPSVQRKISSGPEVRGFSSLTVNELPRLNRMDPKPEVSRKPGTTLQLSKTVVRSSNTVIQEEDGTKAIKQEISEQSISDDFTKVDFRQKISMFEKPRLRPVSMPLISSQQVNNVETTPVQKSTAAPRRISPAKFAQSPTDPRDDLLKSIRDLSSGYSLKKTGISLN